MTGTGVIRLTDVDQLGEALAEMRTTRGLKRQDLAEQAGMKPTQYGTYENGHKVPNSESLLRLTEAARYDLILLPRELTDGLIELAQSAPFNALAALAALAHLDADRGETRPTSTESAEHPPAGGAGRAEPAQAVSAGWTCPAETPSWDHYTPEQTDSYWIRCTLTHPHTEHKDEHTGLTWRSEESA